MIEKSAFFEGKQTRFPSSKPVETIVAEKIESNLMLLQQ